MGQSWTLLLTHLYQPPGSLPTPERMKLGDFFPLLGGASDNILKPVLLGKGAPVPMLVIFLGVIGGFMLSGFIGLFTGAVVMSIGYKLFTAWINKGPTAEKPGDS